MTATMELRQLRYFVAVAEHGGFTRAAAHLRVAQPPVSRQIAQLEAELGAVLFDRSGRTTALTAAGEQLLSDARRILDDVERSVGRARSVAATAATIGVDFVPSAFAWVVPEILRRHQADESGGGYRLSERRPHEIVAALRDGESDVGFIHQARPPNDGAVDVETVFREPLLAALPRDHRLADEPRIRPAELRDDDFVLNQADEQGGLRSTIVELCRVAGFTPKVRQSVWLHQTTLGLVAAGIGVTLVPASTTRAGREGVCFVSLHDCPTSVSVDMLFRRSVRHRGVERFLAVARAWADEVADTPAALSHHNWSTR